jgi:hypothetical protein
MPENLDPEAPREPYFQQSSTGSDWHRISQEALIESTVASITVESADLSNWASSWALLHMEHADADTDDDNSGDENSSSGPCLGCGELPPREYDTLVVEASDKPYVTIHDYITAVHPWLMSLRQDILESRNVWDDEPPNPDTKLMVCPGAPHYVVIDTEENWKRETKNRYDDLNREETPFENAGPKGKKRKRDED